MSTPRLLRSQHQRPRNNFTIQDFQIGASLGQGKFSEVLVAKQKKYGFFVAIKAMNKAFLRQQGLQKQVERQIKLHSKYEHQNILQLYGYFLSPTKIYLILELSDQGDLFTYFKSKKQKCLGEAEASKYIRDVCRALEVLHADGIIHRDLKPENILLCNGVAKLGDFGLAAKCSLKRTTFCGTMDYIAPQMFDRRGHSEKIDVWSVGVLAYELCSGRAPFASQQDSEVEQQIKRVQLDIPRHFSNELVEFIEKTLVKDQKDRAAISELLKMKWLNMNYDQRK